MITINNLDFHYPQQAHLLESLTLHLQAGNYMVYWVKMEKVNLRC